MNHFDKSRQANQYPSTVGGQNQPTVATLAASAAYCASRQPVRTLSPCLGIVSDPLNPNQWRQISLTPEIGKSILRPEVPQATASKHMSKRYAYAMCMIHVAGPSGTAFFRPQEALLDITSGNASLIRELYLGTAGGALLQYGNAHLYKSHEGEQVHYIRCINDYSQPALLPILPSVKRNFEDWIRKGVNLAENVQEAYVKAATDHGVSVDISMLPGDASHYCRAFRVSDAVFVRRNPKAPRYEVVPEDYQQYYQLPTIPWQDFKFLMKPDSNRPGFKKTNMNDLGDFVKAYFRCLRDESFHDGKQLPHQPEHEFAFLHDNYAIQVKPVVGFQLICHIRGLDKSELSVTKLSRLLLTMADPKMLNIKYSSLPARSFFWIVFPKATDFFDVRGPGQYERVFRVKCLINEVKFDAVCLYDKWTTWKGYRDESVTIPWTEDRQCCYPLTFSAEDPRVIEGPTKRLKKQVVKPGRKQ